MLHTRIEVMRMTLSVNNQLTLLHDILDEHHLDRSASIAEHQQLKRLVQAIMDNNHISDEQLLQYLQEIYHYGQQGENASSQTDHISSNKNNIVNWISAIQQTNLK